MTNDDDTKQTVEDENLFRVLFERLRPELEAVAEEDLLPVNLDVAMAVSTTLGVLPELRTHRDGIVAALPLFNLEQFDELEEYAMALSHANTLHSIALHPSDDLRELYDEGLEILETIQADTAALIRRHYIDPARIKNVKGANGYRNVADCLQVYGTVLMDHFPTIQGKCAISMGELEHALKLAACMMRVLGLREQSPAVIEAATKMRMRAFTLFITAYDQARRAIQSGPPLGRRGRGRDRTVTPRRRRRAQEAAPD